MRIAILTDGIHPFVIGGMQKHSTNLVKHLTIIGCDVTLIHCVDYISEVPTDKQINDFLFNGDACLHKIITLKFPRSKRFPGQYIYNSKKYSKIIFQNLIHEINNYDFIYAKGFTAWKLLKEKKKGLRSPKIGINFHGYEMFQYAPSLKSKLKQYLFRPFVKWNNLNSDYVFSYGSKISEIIKSIGVEKDKIVEIPSGIEEEWIKESHSKANEKIKFLFLGRYERRKGIEELNIVLNKIIKQNIKAEFHFIGPIPEIKRLRNTDNKVIYYGSIVDLNKIKSIMDNCDVMLCPSYSEGMPNVILEGMARGLAIIATNVGAVPLMVSEDNGILIDRPSPRLIKNAIVQAHSMNKNELLMKKRKSIEKVKKSFLWSEIAAKTKNLIELKIKTQIEK